ncbi:unnamed protein product [Didymodactylos carnosus]|uniref:G-protein coupled receptors family 1 profile domain-containing protein n=1 Tax=Didymodactylos carnosus TaxID=1234261 RepID=A0A816BK84_9BILA|nr:unnamed protein product [Didymodactylos carnosus]CAF1611883.1 unnamed protein product [Didymodactylos carnosus]CAF4050151.1 unnamed protein product [Didymodactylos carnosus]CAF4495241.1 unnamed protein product [Didymodactylos carnosus]
MTSTSASINFITKQLQIYVGLFFITTGIIGSTIYFLLFFYSPKLNRRAYSHYILTLSLLSIIYLLNTLLSRVVINGFGIDLTTQSRFLCKFRAYSNQYLLLCFMYLFVLASFDRYTATKREVEERKWTRKKYVHRFIMINLLFWLVICIPHLIAYNIGSNGQCACLSSDYQLYLNYFAAPALVCLFPNMLVGVLGVLTYRNLTQLHQRQRSLERQLIRLNLSHICATVLSTTPYCLQRLYAVIYNAPKSTVQLALDSLFISIGQLSLGCCFASIFYTSFLTSKDIRMETSKLFLVVIRGKRQNQIQPTRTVTRLSTMAMRMMA